MPATVSVFMLAVFATHGLVSLTEARDVTCGAPITEPEEVGECKCRKSWLFKENVYNGCAQTATHKLPWCYLNKECKGAEQSFKDHKWWFIDCTLCDANGVPYSKTNPLPTTPDPNAIVPTEAPDVYTTSTTDAPNDVPVTTATTAAPPTGTSSSFPPSSSLRMTPSSTDTTPATATASVKMAPSTTPARATTSVKVGPSTSTSTATATTNGAGSNEASTTTRTSSSTTPQSAASHDSNANSEGAGKGKPGTVAAVVVVLLLLLVGGAVGYYCFFSNARKQPSDVPIERDVQPQVKAGGETFAAAHTPQMSLQQAPLPNPYMHPGGGSVYQSPAFDGGAALAEKKVRGQRVFVESVSKC